MERNLEQVLIDVRKAYRLLNEYHRRIVELPYAIGRHCQVEFNHWYAEPGLWTSRDSSRIDNYEQSFLWFMPLQRASFVFTSNNSDQVQKGEWLLEVTHVGDTAYDPNAAYQVEHMPPEEKTSSDLWLSAAVIASDSGATWRKLWADSLYPFAAEAKPNVRKVNGSDVWFGKPSGTDVQVTTRKAAISEFANEEGLKRQCEDFLKLVAAMKG